MLAERRVSAMKGNSDTYPCPSPRVGRLRDVDTKVGPYCDDRLAVRVEGRSAVDLCPAYRRGAPARTVDLLHFADRPIERRAADRDAGHAPYGRDGIVGKRAVREHPQPERLGVL